VINLDLPKTMEDYGYRIGRIGRVGSSAHATSFYIDKELFLVAQIRRAITDAKPRNTMGFATRKVARRKEREQAVAFRE
jgi:ATP-dependent RNA helicase DDX5/DBP2